MAFDGPFVLKANFSMGTSAASAFDVSDQITQIRLGAKRAVIEVPPTGTTAKGKLAGSADWEAEVGWLGNDQGGVGANNNLTRLFYNALLDSRGELYLSGTMRAGAPSSTNPRWSASFIVTGVGFGGTQETLFEDKQTFALKAAPSLNLA